jgi:hypothetical protein
MEHLVLRHQSHRPGFTYPFFISVSGTPRDPNNTGLAQWVAPLGGGSGAQSISVAIINHQILYSSYKFKEVAPPKEYLRQRVSVRISLGGFSGEEGSLHGRNLRYSLLAAGAHGTLS